MHGILFAWILIGASLPSIAAPSAPRIDTPPRGDTPPRVPSTQSVKSWFQDSARFLSNQLDRRWIIGRSRRPAVTDAEAYELACRDAADQMIAGLTGRMHPEGLTLSEQRWLVNRLIEDLIAGRCVRDRSVSAVHKSYGDVWSCAVLVDASRDQLGQLAADYSGELHVRHRTPRQQMFWLLALCGAILVVYAVVNAATKGYFQGRLRAGAYVSIVVLLTLLARSYIATG